MAPSRVEFQVASKILRIRFRKRQADPELFPLPRWTQALVCILLNLLRNGRSKPRHLAQSLECRYALRVRKRETRDPRCFQKLSSVQVNLAVTVWSYPAGWMREVTLF